MKKKNSRKPSEISPKDLGSVSGAGVKDAMKNAARVIGNAVLGEARTDKLAGKYGGPPPVPPKGHPETGLPVGMELNKPLPKLPKV
jgi:hypothetical protein